MWLPRLVLGTALAGLPVLAAAQQPPAQPAAQPAPLAVNWTGFSIGAGIGGEFGTATSTQSGDIGTSSFYASVYGGYDWQVPGSGWVIGLDLGVDPGQGAFGEKAVACPPSLCGPVPGATNYLNVKVNWFADVRPRIGYAFGPYLPFVTVGYGWGQARASATTTGFLPIGGQLTKVGLAYQATNSSLNGVVFGAGVEYRLGPHSAMDVTWLRAQTGVSNVPGGHFTGNSFRIGLNYLF
ncbi:MAG TPA: outer membrane beta-barrel protein [Acetobacteraceae bacterium]|nr:outer membrane beta-barrel protein [Acetobacteraceae bacterium]